MKKLRVLALMHEDLVPPKDLQGVDVITAEWKMEFDVCVTLEELGHEVRPLGVGNELGPLRDAIDEWKPDIVFNLLEGFAGQVSLDHNIVSYLELHRVPYTGSNPRGMLLARDKALTKQLLTYHRIPVPEFVVFPIGRRIDRPRRLDFPLIVKSLTIDASIGISQASVVESDERLRERVEFVHEHLGTDALVERYVDGRELYAGVIGNQRLQVFPIWELFLSRLPEGAYHIATERVKWSDRQQKAWGVKTDEAILDDVTRAQVQRIARRVYRALWLSGYARIDMRLDAGGRVYVLEANPNPQLAYGEDFAESAERGGLEYDMLMQRILNLGLRWHQARSG